MKLTVLAISLISHLAFPYEIAIDAANVKNEVLLWAPRTALVLAMNGQILPQLIVTVNAIHIMIIAVNYKGNGEPFRCSIAENRAYNSSVS
jgi:hypothetical protein